MTGKLRVLITLSAIWAPMVLASESCHRESGDTVKPLVELYTSEGCSSCPPADRWLTGRIDGSDANYLAFHVDYWDYIGWRDRFASPAFSQRQRARAQAAGDWTVYTPQVMVGSEVRVNWRAENAFDRALRQDAISAPIRMELSADPDAESWRIKLDAAAETPVDARARIWLARYQDDVDSVVTAGENNGRRLHHARVVRQLLGPWKLDAAGRAEHSFDVAAAAVGNEWGVMAFAQLPDGRILQSLDLPIGTCPGMP